MSFSHSIMRRKRSLRSLSKKSMRSFYNMSFTLDGINNRRRGSGIFVFKRKKSSMKIFGLIFWNQKESPVEF